MLLACGWVTAIPRAALEVHALPCTLCCHADLSHMHFAALLAGRWLNAIPRAALEDMCTLLCTLCGHGNMHGKQHSCMQQPSWPALPASDFRG